MINIARRYKAMFDWIDFKEEDGEHKDNKVQLLAIENCAFCTRGMKFLQDHGIAYQYTYVDELRGKDKKKLKDEFKSAFGERPLFPTLVVNDEDFQLGFIEKAWKNALGLSKE